MTEPSLSQGPVPPAGWYGDPAHPGRQRWWDGVAWSNQVRLEGTAPSATHGNPAPTLAAGASTAPQSGPWSSQAHGGFRPITRPAAVVSPPVTVPSPAILASFGRRTFATIIDTLLVLAAVTAVIPFFITDFESRVLTGMKVYYADIVAGGQGTFTDDVSHLALILTYCLIAATILYGGISLGAWSRTLGQRLTGIAVAPVDRPAEKVGWNRGIARSIVWTLLSQEGGLFLIVNAFSISMVLWHPKRQSLPDLLARTQVVRRG